MKNLIILFIAIITLSSCTQQKIAYVDSSELLQEYEVMKSFEKEMEATKANFDAKYNGMLQEIQMEFQAFQAKAAKMNQRKAAERNQELNAKYQQIQQMKGGEEYQMRQVNETKVFEILKEVTDFVADYGKKNGYTFILGTNEGTASVLYGKDELNITDTLIEALNNQKEEETVKDAEPTTSEVDALDKKDSEPSTEEKEEETAPKE